MDGFGAIAVLEDLGNPQSIDRGTATGGFFKIEHHQALSFPILANASAALVESRIEAMNNVVDVDVTGTGSPADPWVVTFIDPAEPVTRLTGVDSFFGGTLQLTNPQLGSLVTEVVGMSSGATFSVGSIVDTFGNGLDSFTPAACPSDALCILIESSAPGFPFRIHCNGERAEAATGVIRAMGSGAG